MDTINTINPQVDGYNHRPVSDFVRKFPFGPSALSRLAAVIDAWIDRRRSRIQLSDLSDHQLRDIGLTRNMAMREASRPFWEGGAAFPPGASRRGRYSRF